MAIESVEANAGTGGASFAVDTITGSVQVPYVKLMSGADAAEGLIGGDATNGLDVDVTRVQGTVTVDGSGVTQPVSNAGITTIAGAVSGTEMQVDVVGALPAGTNAIGKLAANSGVDIGDVDVTSIIPGTGATNLGKAIDGAAGATDTGIAPLAIRDDTLSALTPVEGDYVPLRVNSTGALHVTGGGGGTQYAIDDALGATPTGTLAVAIRDDALSALTPVEGDAIGLRVDANGALWVIPSGTTTISGTVTANLSATDNAVLDSIDAAVNGTLTVGSHAVTNAGTFAVQIDGNALTALQLIDDVVHVDDAAFTLGTSKGVMIMGFAGTQSVNANDAAALACETDGALHIHDGGNSITVDGTVTANLSATDNAVLDNIDADLTTIIGHVDGIEGLLTTIDGDTGNIVTSVQLLDDIVKTDDAAFTPATDEVAMAGFFADETATDSVDEGDAGAARMTLDRKQIVTPYPHTAGGLTTFRSLDLDESEEEVKATAGQVYGMWVTNTATSTRFIKFYNATAANVTVGTTTPVITIGIPGNSSDDISGNFGPGGMGIAFDTAITVAATTGVADNDTGAPAANDVIVNIFYK